MKTIQLTKGQVAIVDDEDHEWLSLRKWQAVWNKPTKSYYANTWVAKNGKRQAHAMHRMIMNTVHFQEVDHKNHDTLDNRRKNLQNVSHRQNCANRTDASKLGTNIERTKWSANPKFRVGVWIKGKRIHVGCFDTLKEAQEAYKNFMLDKEV